MKILNKKTIATILALTGVGFVAISLIQWYVLAIAAPREKTAETVPESEAILILGALVYADNTPSPALRDRLDCGAALYKKGIAPKILVSGDNGREAYNEVRVMRDYLVASGVPTGDIVLDYAGFDTYDSCYRARDVFCLKKITIVSQQYHVSRALYIATRLGLDAHAVGTNDHVLSNLPYNYTREALARIKAFLETDIFHRLPKFLGEKLPITK